MKNPALAVLFLFHVSHVAGHGLMEQPPSRNQICGVETQPHEIGNGVGSTPECRFAFESDWNGGYQFMSVLTHDYGRQIVKTTSNVCGFDSETWQGGATPWDTAMDWPTTPFASGTREFVWNIAWGPHFSDTEEFVYYITKSDFVFDASRPLSWDDFESEPFCQERYDPSRPEGNPNIVPRIDLAKFYTYCNVPTRSGRHVIYGEWGRNEWTLERFHGCVDVTFDGTVATAAPQAPTVAPVVAPTAPSVAPIAPVPAPMAPPTTGAYCNWNNCNGVVQGGDYCNENRERCLSCGGNVSWCNANDDADSETSVISGYCNWNNCDGYVQGGPWCNANADRCEQCGNGSQWCP